MLVGTMLAMAAAASTPSTASTDFGIREIRTFPHVNNASLTVATHSSLTARPINLSAIAAIGSAWGRVTSTYRSPEHNRRVGGVRNSFHISGRAIDIARRPGVRHSAIEAAYRAAGYRLIESLDEGDHSHFAFGTGAVAPRPLSTASVAAKPSSGSTSWRIISAPR